MSFLGILKRGITTGQKELASSLRDTLSVRGFDAENLDHTINLIAEAIGEREGRTEADKAHRVNIELAAADEINMMSMLDQLEIMAAYYQTEAECRKAIENALSISLNSLATA
jgi:hypothetical protein